MAGTKLTLTRGAYNGSHVAGLRQGAATAIATGITDNFDFDVEEFDNCTVLVSMSGAVSGDLTVTVEPFDSAGVVVPIPLTPAVAASGPTFVTPNVYYAAQFDLRGLNAIRVAVKNNNAAGETINFVDVLAGWTGVDF